jgi:hypothetical protein
MKLNDKQLIQLMEIVRATLTLNYDNVGYYSRNERLSLLEEIYKQNDDTPVEIGDKKNKKTPINNRSEVLDL